MKNKDLWDQYQRYTEDLTINSRKLAYVAGGLCWFFKSEDGTFPAMILLALLFLVLFFFFDLLHNLLAAVVYRIWIRLHEEKKYKETGTIEGEYDKPVWLDRPAFTCWCFKNVVLLLTYVFLGWHIFNIQ